MQSCLCLTHIIRNSKNERVPDFPQIPVCKYKKIIFRTYNYFRIKTRPLNGPGTRTPLSHSILKLGEFPLPILTLMGNNNWPRMKAKKFGNFQNKSGSKGRKCSRLNDPGMQNHLSHSILKLCEFPSPIISPLG